MGANGLEDPEQEILFRLEVGEQPALRHLGRLGQVAEAQTLEPDVRGEVDRPVQNPLS